MFYICIKHGEHKVNQYFYCETDFSISTLIRTLNLNIKRSVKAYFTYPRKKASKHMSVSESGRKSLRSQQCINYTSSCTHVTSTCVAPVV